MVTCQAGRPSSDGGQKLTTKQTAGPSSLATDGLLASVLAAHRGKGARVVDSAKAEMA